MADRGFDRRIFLQIVAGSALSAGLSAYILTPESPQPIFESKDFRVEPRSKDGKEVRVVAKHESALRRGVQAVRVFCGVGGKDTEMGERRKAMITDREYCTKVLQSKPVDHLR